jgi:hypothetical protein
MDLPSVDSPNYDQKVRETVSTYLGNRGDPLDKGMTLRDIVAAGLVTLSADGKTIVGAGSIITDMLVDQYIVDTSPPPMPTGFTADAAFTTILMQHDGASYKEGNGHSHTNIYGVTYTSGPLPQFTDAVKLTEFKGSVFSYPTNPATTFHLWATWVTNDGVESTSPAGGINGVVVTTGQDIALLLKSLNSSIGVSELAKALSTAISDSTAGVDYLGTQNGIRVQATADGKTVIGGFGVMGSTADAAGPTIDFGVMANRFYVAAPASASGVVSSVPFVIQTTATPATGNTPAIPAGIYMDEAFIKNASITSAKIGSVNADSIATGVLKAVVNQSGAIYNGVPAYSLAQDPVTKVWSANRTNWNPTNNTGSGYYLGALDGSPTFFVGNAINNMSYSGTTLTVKGEIYASKGTFGGIIIGSRMVNGREVGHIRSKLMTDIWDGHGFFLDADGRFGLGNAPVAGQAYTSNGQKVRGLTWDGTDLNFGGSLFINVDGSVPNRTQITDDGVIVFANGVPRVRIGKLT